jgi:hypothetical protein
MASFKIRTGGLIILLLLAGCASVETGQEWTRFQDITRERTKQELVWEKSDEEEEAIRQEVDELLAHGLSRDGAVRIALLNNRPLQSAFEEIGISKSDLVQAGLFSNPSLGAIFRFLISSGSGTNIEAEGFFPVSDLWQIPFRKKAAAAQLDATITRVGQMVTETVAEAKRSYDRVYYLMEAKRETEEILERFKEIGDQWPKPWWRRRKWSSCVLRGSWPWRDLISTVFCPSGEGRLAMRYGGKKPKNRCSCLLWKRPSNMRSIIGWTLGCPDSKSTRPKKSWNWRRCGF